MAVAVLESHGLSEAQSRTLQRATEVALRELSGFDVRQARSAKRRCASDDCLKSAARQLGADWALLLSARSGAKLSVDGHLVGPEGRVATRKADGDAPEAVVKAIVESLLPPHARKGWGGLDVEAPPGAHVKIDGRTVGRTPMEAVPVTASVHAVDVLFPSGQAVLQRVSVPEGARLKLPLHPADGPTTVVEGEGRSRTLRTVSYGLWTAGAMAIAGSLLAGAASRQASSFVRDCRGDERDCTPYAVALERHQQAESYAQTANVLLVAGGALSAAGVGLFAFDVARF